METLLVHFTTKALFDHGQLAISTFSDLKFASTEKDFKLGLKEGAIGPVHDKQWALSITQTKVSIFVLHL